MSGIDELERMLESRSTDYGKMRQLLAFYKLGIDKENAKLRECLKDACSLQLRCNSCKIRKCDSICAMKLKWRTALDGGTK